MTKSDRRRLKETHFVPMEPAWCPVCDARLPDIRNWGRIYCGKQCGTKARNHPVAQSRAAARAELRCIMCDKPMPDARRQDAKTCSKLCRGRMVGHQVKLKRAAARKAGLIYRSRAKAKNPPPAFKCDPV